MAETIQEQIRRHQREREEQGMPPRPPRPWGSDEKYEIEGGFHGGLLAQVSGRLHPASPFDHTRLHGAEPSPTPLYPTTGGDPTQKPNYDPPPKPAPPPQEPIERPRARPMAGGQAPAPLQPRHARHEDVVRELTKEVRQRPAAANANPPAQPKAPQQGARQFSVHGGRWVANGHATTYDPASGRVRIWIPGENRGLNVSLDSLDPESQKFVTGNTRRGRVGDLADGYHNQQGVLHFDRLEPGEMGDQPAAPKPAAPRPAPQPAPNPAPARAVQADRGAPVFNGFGLGDRPPARPPEHRDRKAEEFHMLGKDWLFDKLVNAADAAGIENPAEFAGEQVRIIAANNPDSQAHPLTIEVLQLTPEARWAVPGGGRFAGQVAGEQPRPRGAAAPAPARRPAGEMPGAPVAKEGRPGPIAPPAPKGPAPRVDPTKPPEPGFNRFRTRDGAHAFDGQIVSYDPDTGTVKIQTPTGHKVSIEYGYLDDDSKSLFEGRVAEHNEKVEFEDEREDFDDKHGKGAHENRFAPEMAFPEHRGADGMGGARLAARRRMDRDAARQREVDAHNAAMGVTPEPGPVADVPPAARAAAEAAAPQDDAVSRAERRLAEKKERLRQLELAEPRDLARTGELRNGPADLERLQRELDAARAGVGRPAAVPPKRNETPDHIVEARKRNEGRRQADAGGMADYDAYVAAGRKGPAPQSARDVMTRKFQQAVQAYRRNARHHGGKSVLEVAKEMGVDTDLVDPVILASGSAAANKAADHQAQHEFRANAHRRSNMQAGARTAAAQAILQDPESTPHQRAAAYTDIGRPDLAKAELDAHATTTSAKHQADAAADLERSRRPGEESDPTATPLQQLAEATLGAFDDDVSGAAMEAALGLAIHQQNNIEAPIAAKYATLFVQKHMWSKIKEGKRNAVLQHFITNDVIGDARSDKPKPKTYEQFEAEAKSNGVNSVTAAQLWEQATGRKAPVRRAPAPTEVGIPETTGIE